MISFYTGFRTYDAFVCFYHYLRPAAQNMSSFYYQPTIETNRAGKSRNMPLIDVFMFLCRLKTKDLAVGFNCSASSVSRTVITWANLLYCVLGRLPIWLPKTTIQALMPKGFKEDFSQTRVIIDCCEIEVQQLSSVVSNSQLYSHYKGWTTLKCLVGIAPRYHFTETSEA